MPFYNIERNAAGASYGFNGPLQEGLFINGKINGRNAKVAIIGRDSLTLNGVILTGENASVLFDPTGIIVRTNRLLINLDEATGLSLERLKNRADEPLLGGRESSELATKLADIYKFGVKNLGEKRNPENLIYKAFQWSLALIGFR